MTLKSHVRFLPGMMCDARVFSPQLALPTVGGNASVARFDRAETIEEMAAHALQDIDEAPCVLVGLSMGGIVAMECVRQAPHRIRALVLMDTNSLAETPERQSLRGPQIERALAGELESILIEEMKPLYLAPANRNDERLLSTVLTMATDLGRTVFARQSRALAQRCDYSDTLRHWSGPTLILCGEHDALCPPERHRYLQELMPQAQLQIIANAGHLPTLETADTVNRLLEGFLADLQSA